LWHVPRKLACGKLSLLTLTLTDAKLKEELANY
jgi:hypothetical protein